MAQPPRAQWLVDRWDKGCREKKGLGTLDGEIIDCPIDGKHSDITAGKKDWIDDIALGLLYQCRVASWLRQ